MKDNQDWVKNSPKTLKQYEAVDYTTGEITNRAVADYNVDTHRIQKKPSQEYRNKVSKDTFAMVYDKFNALLLEGKLKPIDTHVFMVCALNTDFNGRVVIHPETGARLNQSGIIALTGCDKNTVKKSLDRLIALGLLEMVQLNNKSMYYQINPDYVFRGDAKTFSTLVTTLPAQETKANGNTGTDIDRKTDIEALKRPRMGEIFTHIRGNIHLFSDSTTLGEDFNQSGESVVEAEAEAQVEERVSHDQIMVMDAQQLTAFVMDFYGSGNFDFSVEEDIRVRAYELGIDVHALRASTAAQEARHATQGTEPNTDTPRSAEDSTALSISAPTTDSELPYIMIGKRKVYTAMPLSFKNRHDGDRYSLKNSDGKYVDAILLDKRFYFDDVVIY